MMLVETSLDDATLEWAAKKLEGGSFLDFRGVMSRRKRDREDAQLRMDARREMRAEAAATLRAFVKRSDLSPRAVLERIAAREGADADDVVLLRDAWPLAWARLVTIRLTVDVVGKFNSIPPATSYAIALTDKGRALLKDDAP